MRLSKAPALHCGRPLTLTTCLALALIGTTTFAHADTGRGHIPLRTSTASDFLKSFDERLGKEDWSGAFTILRQHHADLWERQPLHFLDESKRPTPHRRNVSLTRTIVDRLQNLPEEAIAEFCSQFDQTARSLFDASLARRSIEDLERCFMLYPLTAAGQNAAFIAGELLVAEGATARARAIWTLAAATPKEQRCQARLQQYWLSTDPESTPLLADMHSPTTTLPTLPFDKGELVWKSRLAGTPQDMGLRILPCFREESMWVATGSRVTALELTTGLTQETVRLPRARGYDDFTENGSPRFHKPLLTGDRLLTSYVRVVNEPERFAGYSIKVAIPQRSLKSVPLVDAHSWDSAAINEFLAELSLNAPVECRGNDLFALGWREAGYIDVYLICLDANNGQLKWKTLLASNQLELTVFGELAREPLMGEVKYHAGLIYACTNLGVMAAVEAHDGRARWLTEYPQRKRDQEPSYYYPERRRPHWDSNPMVIHRDRIVVTPLDATSVFAFDKRSGKIVDSGNRQSLSTTQIGVHDGALVTQSLNIVRVTPLDDLATIKREITLHDTPNGLPLLVSDGVVYISNRGIHHRSLVDLEDVESDLFLYPAPLPDDSLFYPCTLAIHAKQLFATSPREVRCYGPLPPGPLSPREPPANAEQRPN